MIYQEAHTLAKTKRFVNTFFFGNVIIAYARIDFDGARSIFVQFYNDDGRNSKTKKNPSSVIWFSNFEFPSR